MEAKFYENMKEEDVMFTPPPCPVCREPITEIGFTVAPSPHGGWCIVQWHLECCKCGAKTESVHGPRGISVSMRVPRDEEDKKDTISLGVKAKI
jgi:C4-type Zn-finger protein